MPSPSLTGTVTTGTGNGTSCVITPPDPGAATAETWVFLRHPAHTNITFDNLDGFTIPHMTLAGSNHQASMSIRWIRFTNHHDSPRTVRFLASGSPAATRYEWIAFTVARDPDFPNVPVIFDVSQAAAATAAANVVTLPDITPTFDDALILHVAGWSRATTMTPVGAVSEVAEVRAGNSSNDATLWVGRRTVVGGAGEVQSATVGNDNPYGHADAPFSAWSISAVVDPPPALWEIDIQSGLPGNLQNFSAADRLGDPGFGPLPRIEIRTDDPPPGCDYYYRMHAHEGDVAPLTPNENPRAQLVSPRYMLPGDTWYNDSWLRLPEDFPNVPYGQGRFHMLTQVHGGPYIGPPIAIYTQGNAFHLSQRDIGGEPAVITKINTVWRRPLIKGKWIHMAWRIHVAYDGSGYVDFWWQGRRQRLADGRLIRWHGTTLEGPTWLEYHNTNYRSHSTLPGVVTVDHAGMRMSRTPPPEIDLGPPVFSSGRVV